MSVKSIITILMLSSLSFLSSGCVDEEDKFLRENLRDYRWMYIVPIAGEYDYFEEDQSKEIKIVNEGTFYRYRFNNIEPPVYLNTPPPPLTFYESVKTLIGVDRDQDSIRDDFERYVNYRYGIEPPIRELLHEYNRLWQKMVEEYFVKQNTFFPELYNAFYRMRRCILAHNVGSQEEEKLMFNTKMRYQAFLDITYSHWKKMEQELSKYDITNGNKKSRLLCPEKFIDHYTIKSSEETRLIRSTQRWRK